MYRPLLTLVLVAFVLGPSACSKRQLGPTILAGSGAALMVGGVAYRASFHEEEDAGMLGRTAEQRAVTSTLLFSGLALIVAGVIWSATQPICEADHDCWIGDACEPTTGTCVPDPDRTAGGVATAGAPAEPSRRIALPRLERRRLTLELGPPVARVSQWQPVAR